MNHIALLAYPTQRSPANIGVLRWSEARVQVPGCDIGAQTPVDSRDISAAEWHLRRGCGLVGRQAGHLRHVPSSQSDAAVRQIDVTSRAQPGELLDQACHGDATEHSAGSTRRARHRQELPSW